MLLEFTRERDVDQGPKIRPPCVSLGGEFIAELDGRVELRTGGQFGQEYASSDSSVTTSSACKKKRPVKQTGRYN